MPATMRKVGTTVVLKLEGKLLLGESVDDFRRHWSDALATGSRNFVVDLSAVPVMDSSGVGTLLRSHTAVNAAGGKLKVVGANKVVRQALRVTRLERLFEFYDTEESAIASFTMDSG
jgi:anti-sigma B factor antagonist